MLSDGSVINVDLDKDYTDDLLAKLKGLKAGEEADGDLKLLQGALVGSTFSYSKGTSGTYTLAQPETASSNWVPPATVKYTAGDSIIENGRSSILKADKTYLYANSNTVFVLNDKDDTDTTYSSYTGYANVPDVDAYEETKVTAYVDKGVVKVVYVTDGNVKGTSTAYDEVKNLKKWSVGAFTLTKPDWAAAYEGYGLPAGATQKAQIPTAYVYYDVYKDGDVYLHGRDGGISVSMTNSLGYLTADDDAGTTFSGTYRLTGTSAWTENLVRGDISTYSVKVTGIKWNWLPIEFKTTTGADLGLPTVLYTENTSSARYISFEATKLEQDATATATISGIKETGTFPLEGHTGEDENEAGWTITP